MSRARVLSALLSVLPIVPPVVFFVVAAVRDDGFGQVVLMLVLAGLSFLVTLSLVLVLRIRRSAASPPAIDPIDAVWVGGATLAWVAAGFTVELVRFGFVVVALVVSALAARHLFRVIRRVVSERVARDTGQRGPRGGPYTGGPAAGPDAGKVIVLEPSAPRSDAPGPRSDAEGGGAGGDVPGSTRHEDAPRSDSTRPGTNFGANRAPVSPTWDETRPVRDAASEGSPGAEADDAPTVGDTDAGGSPDEHR
ncbi:hypothetical protein F8O01_04750 [Pseudoclavibacter chungangensis]|uniref:Uncharacterized protein n=1 Tax=Pseudoclavibacter chungangensis TaxID=587635 RepID=A0A7J5BZ05_9MICO|nr:hypothetical protein [Pseudoclavibacter chungangensis]KAB1659580.1 hypothetical protein F8O01_04750 [Pseudoclavibacter chungangensis]NYJ67402.1 hypothetical protein [Pseudoclavibacter chungangensis]